MRSPSALRFSFQAKVLVPVLAFLILLPTVTLWIINRHVSEQALAEGRRTLTTADAVFRNSLDILGRALATRFKGVVNEPRFKAVAQLGDANTMTDFLRESLEEAEGEVEFIIYSQHPGSMLAGARSQSHVDFDTFIKATTGLAQVSFEGEVATGTILASRRNYSVVSVPVISSDRLSISGVLTIGLFFGNSSLQELKLLTRADIAIFSGKLVTATTLLHQLPAEPEAESAAHGPLDNGSIFPLVVEDEHFFALSGNYAAAPGRPGFHYLLMSSYEARLQALQKTQFKLVGISLLGLAVSATCVWWMIRRITQPLRALRDSAEAVGRGDFSRRIEQFSNDECGELAGTFNHMTTNLLASRTELQNTVDTLRATDARLRESEEQLRLTIESARDHMICTFDSRGRVQRWNAAAERVLGHTASEAHGLEYASFFDAEEKAAGVPERLLATAASSGRDAFEGWRVRRDGTRFWADVTLSRLPDGAGFVEISRDSTLRREAEETLRSARDAAEAANRAKTDFIANMSHELRTPMNAIIGMSSLLLDDALPNETRECVQTIRTSADALLEIIDDILDISKIEAGRLELDQQPFDLCGCVEGVVDLYTARCRERGLELAVHLALDLPAIVVGDTARLRQILSNIVGNAVKFTERGGVVISVSREHSGEGQDRLMFSVQDTGIGIPANRMDRLFKMFSQVDASTTRRFGGNGLGLAIAKRLVELMGGAVGAESEVGRGSRFYFSIVAPDEPARMLPEFSGLEDRKILVVGSETITTSGLRQQLATWGAHVTCIPTASTGISTYDLVVFAPEIVAVAGEEGVPRAVIQLTRTGSDRMETVIDGCINLAMPVKPRMLHATARKVIDLARRPATSAPSAPLSGVAFSKHHPLRILLVEDNPVNAHVAQLLLRRLGYNSDWALNGRKAIESLVHETYDLVLMDLQMPEMDGLEATRALLSVIPARRVPYVVALTANARKDDRDACAEAGMHDFISKPAQLEKFTAVLERAHRWITARSAANVQPTAAD